MMAGELVCIESTVKLQCLGYKLFCCRDIWCRMKNGSKKNEQDNTSFSLLFSVLDRQSRGFMDTKVNDYYSMTSPDIL